MISQFYRKGTKVYFLSFVSYMISLVKKKKKTKKTGAKWLIYYEKHDFQYDFVWYLEFIIRILGKINRFKNIYFYMK